MAKNLRQTRQRNAIKRVFREQRRPLGPKEVIALASEEVPNLGIATVYRNVKAMMEENELEPVEIPGQSPRYCLPEDRTPNLFVCEKTDRVFFLSDSTVRVTLLQQPDSCKVDRSEAILYGVYRD